MEFSKIILIFSMALVAATWIVAVFSWVFHGELPYQLMIWVSGFFCVELASYMAKSCIENKAKIERTNKRGEK